MTRVFYSWQSDIEDSRGRKPIRIALNEAATKLEKEIAEANFQVEEATSNLPGSPNIPNAIAEKISLCDIFVADITTIYAPPEGCRPVANPNVLIELGYAIASIGWDRIVLVFNKKHGNFPTDLPFDIDRHRVLDFSIDSLGDSNGIGALRSALCDAIRLIMEKNPPKPIDGRNLTPEQQKRNNDLSILRQLFKNINLALMDVFIENLPDRIDNIIFYFYEGFHGFVRSSYFFIHDSKLKQLVEDLDDRWNHVLSFDRDYRYEGRIERHIFNAPMDIFTKEQKADYDKISELAKEMYGIYRELLAYVRTSFIEIDVIKSSSEAMAKYREFHADMAV